MPRHRKRSKATQLTLTLDQRQAIRELLREDWGSIKRVADLVGCDPNNVCGWFAGRTSSKIIQEAVLQVAEEVKQKIEAQRDRVTALIGEVD